MAQAWSGDGSYRLPAGRVEPYRLWFEFLKLAYRDPQISVAPDTYADWGDIADQSFNIWWKAHWRELFAVTSTVTKLCAGATVPSDDRSITLHIPMTGSTDAILNQVSAFLAKEGVNLKEQGQFGLSLGYEQGFIKQMDKARRYVRLYGYWLKHAACDPRKRVERAARDYVGWYAKWETKVRAGSKRRITPMPYFYKTFVGYLDQKSAKKQGQGGQAAYGDGNAENARRQIVRDIRIARKIAENVAQGEFPGRY